MCFRRRKVAALKVCMPVEVIARLCNLKQPIDGFQPLMSLTLFIMDAKRRRMSNKNIQRASKVHPVQGQPRKQAEGSKERFVLCILVRSVRAVMDGPPKATDQKPFIAYQFQIQV